jgi:predicted dehydrogenase
MSDPLRYIIVTAGGQGGHWHKQVLPRFQATGKAVAVAAVDTNTDRLQTAGAELGLAPEHCFTDAMEAFERRRADFAIISVPAAASERHLEMALTFDLDVLIDPPFAESFDAALRMYAKTRKVRRRAAVAMYQRYDQDKQTLLRLVRNPRAGRLHYLVCRFTDNNRRSPQWGRHRHEMRDPLMVEAAFQHLDVCRALADSNAKTVYAMSWNPQWAEYRGDSTAILAMEMENGVHCLYEGAKANASTLNGWNNEYIRAECANATFELDRRQVRIYSNVAMEQPKVEEVPLISQPLWGNQWVLDMFCDWLRGGEEPATRLKDSVRCSAMLFAATRSAHTGRPVDVREFLRQHGGE